MHSGNWLQDTLHWWWLTWWQVGAMDAAMIALTVYGIHRLNRPRRRK